MWNAALVDDPPPPAVTRLPVFRVEGEAGEGSLDALAVEEPLEIRVAWETPAGRREQPLSITMRTPGEDVDLAVGFLFGEGVLRSRADLVRAEAVRDRTPEGTSHAVLVTLARDASRDIERLARHFYTTSSCGVCGKASIELLRLAAPSLLDTASPMVSPSLLHGLPGALRARQRSFEATGGLHAAGLFDASGRLLALREDVGRHNAVDKLVGAMLRKDEVPLSRAMLLVSGRASFELVQKALMASVPVFLAVGAPSSLAVELARESGMTLVGFLRDGRFNVYAGRNRVTA